MIGDDIEMNRYSALKATADEIILNAAQRD